jgi:hypothetical protein
MARRKATPDRTMIVREATVAWSRRARTEGGDDPDEPEPKRAETKSEDTAPLPMKPSDAKKADKSDKVVASAAGPVTIEKVEPKAESKAEPNVEAKDAKPSEAKKADSGPVQARAQTETVAMPIVGATSRPPDMPQSVAPPPLALGDVENPTHMPGPKDIPSGEPGDRAPAPGVVPRGDSRSLRRANEFALIYRVGTYVISRFGTVGQRGQWRVVEYPTSSAASHSYAKECSRFVSEGFSDYRE